MSKSNHSCAHSAPLRISKCAGTRPRWRLVFGFAVLASGHSLVTQATGQDAQLQSRKTDSIQGIVSNRVTHEPIAHALVFSPDSRFGTRTDDQGRFEFTLPPAVARQGGDSASSGPVALTAPDRPNILTARKPGFLGDSNATVQLTPAEREVTITLTPEALIMGRVTLSPSDLSDRIGVELYRRDVQEGRAHWVMAGSGVTKSSGMFRFAELIPGTYKLLTRESLDRDPITFDPRGQLFGYPPIYYPSAADFSATGAIVLSAGKIFQADLSPVRQPYYPVKVSVGNATPGVPMNVSVWLRGHEGPGYSLGYNEQDRMIEGSLPNGTYTVEASSFGQAPATGSLNVTVRGGPVEGATITLAGNSSIAVNVKEEYTRGQEPGVAHSGIGLGISRPGGRFRVRDVNVALLPADDFLQGGVAWMKPPTGPQDDSLVIESVRPGRYWVQVTPMKGFASSVSCGGVDLLQHPLVVASGVSTPPIEVTLRDDSAEVEGTIEGLAASGSGEAGSELSGGSSLYASVGDNGQAAGYVYFVPLPDSSGHFTEAAVSPDGKFRSEQLPPGAYRVLAFDTLQPQLEYRNPEAMRAYDSKGPVIHLTGGQKEHLRPPLISTSE